MAKRRMKKRLKPSIQPVEAFQEANTPSPPDLSLVNRSFNNLYANVADQARAEEGRTVKFADDFQQPLIYLKYYALDNNKNLLIETGRTHDDDRTPMENAVVVNRHYALSLFNYSRKHRNQAELKVLLGEKNVVLTTLTARKDIISGTVSVLFPDSDQQQQQQQNEPKQPEESVERAQHRGRRRPQLQKDTEDEIASRWSVVVHYTYNEWATVGHAQARLIKHHVRTNIARYEFFVKLDPNQVQLETSDCFALYVRVTSSDGRWIFLDNNIGLFYLAKINVDE